MFLLNSSVLTTVFSPARPLVRSWVEKNSAVCWPLISDATSHVIFCQSLKHKVLRHAQDVFLPWKFFVWVTLGPSHCARCSCVTSWHYLSMVLIYCTHILYWFKGYGLLQDRRGVVEWSSMLQLINVAVWSLGLDIGMFQGALIDEQQHWGREVEILKLTGHRGLKAQGNRKRWVKMVEGGRQAKWSSLLVTPVCKNVTLAANTTFQLWA